MSVPFRQIPQGLRTPLFYAEVDPSHANTGEVTEATLLIGQKVAAGVAPANVPVICASITDAKNLAGAGSQLALMVAAYLQNDPQAQLWLLPLVDDPGSTKAAGSLVLAGAPTANGVLSLYVGGVLVALPVTTGQATTAIATALAAALNANLDLPVSAAANASTVTLTADNGGVAGNDIDLRLNYRGSAAGEVLPAGVSVSITAMAGGATNPSLTAGLAVLGDQPFDFIVSAYQDAASLASLSALMVSRWGYASQIYGHVFAAFSGTYGAQATFGAGLNDPHLTAPGVYDSPTWRPLVAAMYGGACAQSLKADPALPLQTVPIIGMLAPPVQSRLTQAQRNALLFDGVSTYSVGSDGTCSVEAAITTYQKNAFGQADDSLLRVETLFTLMAVIRSLRAVVTSKFGRVKLASDGARLPPGSAAVTPNVIRAELIAAYQGMVGELVEDADGFAAGLTVERDPTSPNRVNVLWPGNLINGLGVFATLIQFRN